MKIKFWLFSILMLCFVKLAEAQKTRTIVTTDGEIDDVDSFIRMLLYSNEFRLEGLIYSSSMWHYKGDGKGTKFVSEMEMTQKLYGEKTDLRWPGVSWMQDLIAAYQQVYPNLTKNAPGYPTPQYLQSIIKVGNIDFEGEMDKESEGADFIKAKLLDNNLEPLYLQAWGGTNTIAKALKSIEDQYKNTSEWPNIYNKICKKAKLFMILDQDATYRKYISIHWKDIAVYYNSSQFWSLAYSWKTAVPEAFQPYLEGKFMGNEIINQHGPLTKMYYSYGDGQRQVGDDEHIHGDSTKITNAQWGSFKKYDFISEGDSPAFLHLINVGLDNLSHPNYGGWGGRLIQSKTNAKRWEDGESSADYNPFTKKMDLTYTQTRWIKTLQEDFASRAAWCISDFKAANHPPKIVIKNKINSGKPGEKIKITAVVSDPDGNKVKVNYWQYQEVGTCKALAKIIQTNDKDAEIILPKNTGTIHIIAECTDDGKPILTRYQRVIIEVKE